MEKSFNLEIVNLFQIDKLAIMTAYYNRTFSTVTNLTGVSSIASGLFSNFANITSFDFTGITYIGASAFAGCTGLTKVDLHNNSGIILDYSAFANCYGLTELYLPSNFSVSGWGAQFYGCSNLTKVSWPNCTSVPDSLFRFCSKLSDITFLENCDSIDSYAFQQCISITKLNSPTLTTIRAQAFDGCSGISYISLPNLVSTEYDCFYNVGTNLRYISLPQISVNTRATENAQWLSIAYLPQTSIAAFYNCTRLIEAWAPKTRYLGANTFNGCAQLSELYFDDIYGIDNYGVFEYCYALTDLYLAGPTKPYVGVTLKKPTNTAFRATPIVGGSGHIYVRASLVEDYKQDSDWAVVSSQIVGLTDEEFAEARERIETRIKSYNIIE